MSDLVEQLDLSAILRVYEDDERGYPPYHPVMLTKVLVYGCCVGVFSSRRIQRSLVEDAAFRGFAAGNQPDFRTIADFRKTHLPASRGCFEQVLRLARELGAPRVGHVALDSSKTIVEPVLGQIKQARGFRQFLPRGVAKVQGEWALVCTTHNNPQTVSLSERASGVLIRDLQYTQWSGRPLMRDPRTRWRAMHQRRLVPAGRLVGTNIATTPVSAHRKRLRSASRAGRSSSLRRAWP
jgi:hypothetical protein